MELWKYYRILRRRRWLILLGTLICAGVVGTLLYFTPPQYEVAAAVMEKSPASDKINIFGGPFVTMDPKMELANLAQLIKSDRVLRSAATSAALAGVTDPEPIIKALDVSPAMDSMILNISVTWPDRSAAEITINDVTTEFVKYYKELNRGGASSSKAFIKDELPQAQGKVRDARQAVRAFKERSGAVMIGNQTQVLLEQIAQLEGSASQNKVQAQEAAARTKVLEKMLKQYPETRRASSVMAQNPVWQSIKIELSKQQIELQKMLKDRTPEHPEVRALQAQIDETKKNLADAGEKVLNSTTESVNPIRDDLVQRYSSSQTDYTAAVSASSAIQATISALRNKLKVLPSDEATLAELEADEQAAQNTYTLLRQKFDEATIKEREADISSIEVVSPVASRPAEGKRLIKLVLALILSPMLCCGVAFLLHYLDVSVKTPAEAEQLLKLPVSAVVPTAKQHSLAEPRYHSAIAASYQMLSANLWIASADSDARTILIASADPGVGRSTTAANVAITMAQDGARVILVDADLRKPSLHRTFNLDNERGLSNVLAGQMSLRDALKPTTVQDLMVITSGPVPANPVRLLKSPEMTKLVDEINDLADFVIFDSPAGLAFADATLMASLIRNVVIVYAAGSVPRGSEQEFRSRMMQVEANILGVVLNMVRPEDIHSYPDMNVAHNEIARNGKNRAALPGSADASSDRGVGVGSGKS